MKTPTASGTSRTWSSFHSQSEQLASKAELALRQGSVEVAHSLYRQAAESETAAFVVLAALSKVDPSKARTLGATAVSAAALWHKAGEDTKAEQLITEWLARGTGPDGWGLPPFAVSELQELLHRIGRIRMERASPGRSAGER